MLYPFKCDFCGHREDQQHSPKQAPPLDAEVWCPICGGHSLKRLLVVPEIADARIRFSDKYPYASYQHSNLKGVNKQINGHDVIESAAHEREVAAMNNLKRS